MTPEDAGEVTGSSTEERLRRLYLDLLKKALTRTGLGRTYESFQLPKDSLPSVIYRPVRKLLKRAGLELVRVRDAEVLREEGRDWPADAETMIGLRRLDSLQECIESVVRDSVPGDLIEAGVWRGGAVIFMRAALAAFGDESRTVWAADTFAGPVRPDPNRYPPDAGDRHWASPQLAVSLDEVRDNVRRYGFLDDRVRFLVGPFAETLPTAPIQQLSVLRLDGDLYASTITGLEALYPRLSDGGYVILDDYGSTPGCKAATDAYRDREGITDPIHRIDWTGVWWRKGA